MKKVKWDREKINRTLPVAVAVICAAALLGTLYFKLTESKKQVSALRGTIEAQQQNITTLTAERDALKKAAAPTPALPAPPPENSVESLFDPASKTTDFQAKIDALKKRYEEVLVSYFVLRKCEAVEASDYHVLVSALSQEMASMDAPGRLQYDILTSAQGSYKELYSGNECDASVIEPLHVQFKAFIDGIANEFLPR